MEPRAHHILVGIFTLATALALMGFALWLNKAGAEGERLPYDIVFSENVMGLTVGSTVLYTGIAVGEVMSLQLDTKDPSKVWTRISIKRDTPIRQSTTARMSIANITGASVIHLENDDPTSPPLVSDGNHIPVIMAQPSPFTSLKSSGEELLLNVTRLVENANRLFSRENSANIARTLANVAESTSAVAEQKDAISQGIGDLAQASSEFRATIAHTTKLLAQFNQQFEEHGGELVANADNSLKALEALTTNLDKLVTDNQASLTQGAQGLADIGPVINQLEEVISNLNEITRQLEEDPGGYLLGSEKIREYQP